MVGGVGKVRETWVRRFVISNLIEAMSWRREPYVKDWPVVEFMIAVEAGSCEANAVKSGSRGRPRSAILRSRCSAVVVVSQSRWYCRNTGNVRVGDMLLGRTGIVVTVLPPQTPPLDIASVEAALVVVAVRVGFVAV